MVRRAVWTALTFLTALLFFSLGSIAWMPVARAAPATCVVRVSGPSDERTYARVVGQTSDLALTIERVDGPIASDPDMAKTEAETLARTHRARAVIWFSTKQKAGRTDEIGVFVFDAPTRTVLVHRVGRDAGSPSAMLEAAGLVARDALQSLLEANDTAPPSAVPSSGDETRAHAVHRGGSSSTEPTSTAPVAPATTTGTPAHGGRSRAKHALAGGAPPAADGVPWSGSSAVGFRSVLSRAAPSYALDLRLGLLHAGWEFGLDLTLGATSVWNDPFASLRVRRHAIGGYAGHRWRLDDQFTVVLGIHGGAVSFVRATRPRVDFLSASASEANTRAFLGPEARIGWAPTTGGPRFALAVGADVVFSPPAFSYARASERAPIAPEVALWPVQPHATLSLELDLPL